MIETIYSNENGDDNQATRVHPLFKMPKNIRQVGKGSAAKKIYVEDYVMTYIKQLSGEDYTVCKIAVLLGQYVKMDNCRNIFINGAVEVENIDTTQAITFSNEAWTSIYDNIKKYFPEAEIVGWSFGGPGYLLEEEDKILKIHVDNFAGQDKTLLLYDSVEKEESFHIFENNRLCKQEGYYIYYEKNEEMQTYMIDHKSSESEESTYDNRVEKEIRTIIQNKKQVEDNKGVPRLMYAAGTLMAVMMLVVGAAILHNFEKMKTMENALNLLTNNIKEFNSGSSDDKTPALSEEDILVDNNLNVDVVPGNVSPLEEVVQPLTEDNSENTETTDNAEISAEEKDVAKEETDDQQAQETEEVTTVEEPDTEEPDAEEPDTKETDAKIKYYTVLSGDTLVGISFKLYDSANYMTTICKLNDIEDVDMIYEGQRLIVP